MIGDYGHRRILIRIRDLLSGPPGSSAENKFAIIYSPRTGSSLLCGLLSNQAQIICCGELFNEGRIGYERIGAASGWTQHRQIGAYVKRGIRFRDKFPVKFLQRFWSFPTGEKPLGFKISTGQSPAAFQNIIDDRSVKKILLHRRNKLKQYVSYRIAAATNKWHVKETPHQQATVSARDISLDEMRQFFETRETRYKKAKSQMVEESQTFLEIAYEDLIGEERSSWLDQCAMFVGCSAFDREAWMQDPLKKQNIDHLPELIDGYDTLLQKLQGTEFEKFLEVL